MYINIEGLKQSQESIAKTISYLENAVNYCNIKVVPDDYQYKEEIQKLPIGLEEIKENLTGASTRLNQQIEEYTVAEKRNITIAERVTDLAMDTTNVSEESQNVETLNSKITDININSFDFSNLDTALYYFKTSQGELVGVGTERYNECIQKNIELQMEKTPQYEEMKTLLIDKYKMRDEKEVSKILSLIGNDKDLKLYVGVAELIVEQFKDKEQEFNNKFGFSLYKEGILNELVENRKELYTDIFMNIAMSNNIIVKDEYGNNVVNPELVDIDSYLTTKVKEGIKIEETESKKEVIANYLKSKAIVIEL